MTVALQHQAVWFQHGRLLVENLIVMVVLGVFGCLAGLVGIQQRREQMRRLAALSTIACAVCGNEHVEERGPGSYRCGSCRYDTDVNHSPQKTALIARTQDVAIAATCLENAIQELDASRHSRRSVNRGGRSRTEDHGPFFDRYLEGIEQTEEALRLLMPVTDVLPSLEAALVSLEQVPPPPSVKAGFNSRVDEAVQLISAAIPVVKAGRAELVVRFKGAES